MCCCAENHFVYPAYPIGWRLGKNLSWVCPKLCSILASGLENRGYLDALDNICFNCIPPEKWAALFWQNPLTLLVQDSALPLPTGPPGPGATAPFGLWEVFWNHRCSPLLLFALSVLSSFGLYLAVSTSTGRKKSQLVSGPVPLWGSKWFWSCSLGFALVTVCRHVLVSRSRKEVVLSQIGFEVFRLLLHQLS